MIEHGVGGRKDGATGRKRLDEDYSAVTAVLQAGRRLIWAGASSPRLVAPMENARPMPPVIEELAKDHNRE
jgi:hypothetical protein